MLTFQFMRVLSSTLTLHELRKHDEFVWVIREGCITYAHWHRFQQRSLNDLNRQLTNGLRSLGDEELVKGKVESIATDPNFALSADCNSSVLTYESLCMLVACHFHFVENDWGVFPDELRDQASPHYEPLASLPVMWDTQGDTGELPPQDRFVFRDSMLEQLIREIERRHPELKSLLVNTRIHCAWHGENHKHEKRRSGSIALPDNAMEEMKTSRNPGSPLDVKSDDQLRSKLRIGMNGDIPPPAMFGRNIPLAPMSPNDAYGYALNDAASFLCGGSRPKASDRIRAWRKRKRIVRPQEIGRCERNKKLLLFEKDELIDYIRKLEPHLTPSELNALESHVQNKRHLIFNENDTFEPPADR